MKKQLIIYLSVATLLLALLIPFNAFADNSDISSHNTVDILFTHDIHSYLSGYSIKQDNSIIDIGGMPRLQTLIDEKRANNSDLLLLDAGDISMGTLYQSLYETEAIELSMLGRLGFTATTFGNHEFDYGTDGFARMVNSAYNKAMQDGTYELPQYLICNIDWDNTTDNGKQLYSALLKSGVKDYMMVNRNGYNIAILGVLGNNAYSDSPRCELTHLDPIESVKKTVEKIKSTENPDMIICLSHSGTNPDSEKSEDELLAAAVPDLDVIVSAHTHTLLEEPIVCGNTYIVSCKCYTEYSGFVSLSQNNSGRWDINEYEAIHMTQDIAEDQSVIVDLDKFEDVINQNYLDNYDYDTDMYIAYNDGIDFESVADLEINHTEQRLGNIIADAYMYYANKTPTGKQHPIDITVCPAGTVRGTYLPGPITVADIFQSFSLGNGTDKSAGYPLVSIYLTGDEVKTMAELDATVSDLMPAARLYISGLSFEYNPHRIPLNKITDLKLIMHANFNNLQDDAVIGELEDDTLYRIVTDMYTLEMLSTATSMSKGILSVIPKNEDGSAMNDFSEGILYNSDGTESKAWLAIAEYFESFPIENQKIDGVNYTLPTIPDYYSMTHGRKTINDSRNIKSLLSNPSKYFYMIIGIIIILLLLIITIVVVIIKLIKSAIKKLKK